MGTLYGPASALPKYLTTDLICPGFRVPTPGGGFTWKGCRGRLKTWYEGAEDRTVWECSKCGDRNIAKGRTDDPRRARKSIISTGKKRDSQRQAVYDWERSLFGPMPTIFLGEIGQLSMKQCKHIVDTVWTDYGLLNPPKVLDGRGRKNACGSRKEIKLPKFARTASIVLHEVTHSLQEVPEIWPDKKINNPWHSREFTTLVLELWRMYLGMNRPDAKKKGVHQKPRRVRFAPLAVVPKPVRKTKKLEWGIE